MTIVLRESSYPGTRRNRPQNGERRAQPAELSDYPRIIRADNGKVRACTYIGSFDPFQLTHLAVAVRFLASELSNSTLSLWCRGLPRSAKPLKTDYAFAFRLPTADRGIFDPFIKVLDLGMQADTIEIVRRFIGMHSGLTLELTHLIGSDVLPVAARYIVQDMSIGEKRRRNPAYTTCTAPSSAARGRGRRPIIF